MADVVRKIGDSPRLPRSVIVFGILNIVFAVMWWIPVPQGPFLFYVPYGVPIGFSIWLLVLGIGLIKFKQWARRGSVVYAWIEIAWFVIQFGPFLAEIVFKGGYDYEPLRLPGGGPIYSILLLIFMRKEAIKKAFIETAQNNATRI